MVSDTASIPPSPPYGTHAAELALCLGAFALGVSEFAAMGLLPQVAADAGVSVSKGGLTISAYAVGVVVGAPLIALSFTRCPRRRLLIGLALLIAFGNLASAAAPDFLSITAARLVAGLPHGAYLGTAAMVAASLVPPNQRGSAVARVILGLSVANLLGVPLATWLGQLAGWRVVFGTVAVLALGAALLIRLCLPVVAAGPAVGIGREVKAVLHPRVLLALGTAAVGFGGMFAIYSYIAPTLMEVTKESRLFGMCNAAWLRLKAGRENSLSKPEENKASVGTTSMMRPVPRQTTIQSMTYKGFTSGSRKSSDERAHRSSEQASRAG